MNRKRWVAAAVTVTLVVPAAVAFTAEPVFAAKPAKLAVREQLKPTSQLALSKAQSSRLARTDQSLLGRKGSEMVNVVVKLDYDPVASYEGGVRGFAATSPSVTGHPLTGGAAETQYTNHIIAREDAFLGQLSRQARGAKVGQRLRTVYGGLTMSVPANRIDAVAAMPGVVAVQRNERRERLTDASGSFLGADRVYGNLGGSATAGKGVILGVLDSGAWPEHPSFADSGALAAPPATRDGAPRACDFGDNPLTVVTDQFVCNHKVIGGRVFTDDYQWYVGDEPYLDSARDGDGHGTHTASTAAGGAVASAQVLGVDRGPIQGLAGGAWVSVYKVCGELGCFESDSVRAIGRAILDGVNVINFSISGGADPLTDPVELAFLDAFNAGVFVSASAGNSGPAASSSEHASPWVTTVAASTQRRQFSSTLTLASGAVQQTFTGASITQGVGTPKPDSSA